MNRLRKKVQETVSEHVSHYTEKIRTSQTGSLLLGTLTKLWSNTYARWGLVALVCVLAYMAYSAFAPDEQLETVTVRVGGNDALVSVQGTVEPAKAVDLGFEGTGKVEWVGVTVGQTVRKGQAIATLSQSDLSAQIASLVATRDAARIRLEELQRGTRAEDIAVSEAQLISSQSSSELAQQTLADTLQDAYAKLDDAVRTKTDVFFSNPRTGSPQFTVIATDSAIKIQLESDRLVLETLLNGLQARTFLAPVDAATVTEVKNLSQKVRAYLDTLSTAVNLAKGYTSLSDAQIDAHKATVSAARVSVSGYITALTTAQTSASNLLAAVTTAKAQLAQKKAGASREDIRAQEAQIRAANANIVATQALAGKRSIVAPFAGQITRVDPKVGSIASGSQIVSLMSSNSLQMETFVPEVYIAKLARGDKAEIVLDAYGSQTVFTGTVGNIEPKSTIKDGVATYKVIVTFASMEPSLAEKIRPGMGGDIKIVGSKGLPVITIPKKAVVERNGKTFVQIPARGESEVRVIEREIIVGKYNEANNAEITEGLSDGDEIVVSPIK